MRASITSAVGLCLVVASCAPQPVGFTPGGRVSATVVSHIDGDTFTVSIAGRRTDVRLIGLDTPETKHPTTPVECAGPEASAFTATEFPVGTEVELARDIEARDRFGRLLAYVWRATDGYFLNAELLRNGWAGAHPYEPNTSHATWFAGVAADAKAANRGMWAMCHG